MAAGAGRPGAPRKDLPDRVRSPKTVPDTHRKLRPGRAVAGKGHVLLADAAHVVYGTALCRLGAIARVFVRAAPGRQRFHVPGAWDAVPRTLTAVTNTAVANADAMCEVLRAVAARGLVGPVTVARDNARYRRNDVAKGPAKALGIEHLVRPSDSPNLTLIERLWRYTKRTAISGKYHPTFAEFRAAVQDVSDRVPATHANKSASLMTLNFQEFDEVSEAILLC